MLLLLQVRQIKNGKEIRIDLMVMENLLFGRNVSRTYDLKGAVFSRHVSDSKGTGKVLLDQNFVEDMRLSPIYVGGKNKHLLQRAIWNDTAFLTVRIQPIFFTWQPTLKLVPFAVSPLKVKSPYLTLSMLRPLSMSFMLHFSVQGLLGSLKI